MPKVSPAPPPPTDGARKKKRARGAGRTIGMHCTATLLERDLRIGILAPSSLWPPEAAERGLYRRRSLPPAPPRKKQRRRDENNQLGSDEVEKKVGDDDGQPEQRQPLLPGLPDHLARLCLPRLPHRLLFSVCRDWRRLLYSPSFPPFLSMYALLSSNSSSSSSVEVQAFDPVAGAWRPLPYHPQLRHLLLRHPAFLSRPFPVQSVAVAGRLVLLAATTDDLLPALPQPLVFHPGTSRWSLGPPLRNPRRWCVAGSAGGRVYVASGVGHAYSTDVARSVERWNPASGGGWPIAAAGSGWESVAPLPDGRFCREAAEAVASGGKLCTVNVKGKAAKDGAIYDVAGDRWEAMPPGLLAGWTGPAASSGEQEDAQGGPYGGGATIYAVDEAEGELRRYNWRDDRWAVVARSERLRGAMQMAAGGGRVCVACAGGDEVIVVDITVWPPKMWSVPPPAGRRVLAVHVLPRMSH